MNDTISKISGAQLTAVLLASRLSGCLLFTFDGTSSLSLQGCILSAVINGVLLCLLLLPSLFLLRRDGRRFWALTDGRTAFVDKSVNALFLIICVFLMTMDIVQFSDYASRTMRSNFSVLILTVVLIAACLAASGYGIQAIARSSTVVAVFVIVALLVFTGALLPELRAIHFKTTSDSESTQIVKKALFDLPRTAEVLAVGWVYPHVTKRQGRSTLWFVGILTAVSILVSVTSVGVLGDFAGRTPYPYYTAVSAAKAGILQRFDIVVTTVWMATFFMRFALFSFLIRSTAKRAFGERAVLPVLITVFALLSVVAYFIQQGSYNGEWRVATLIYWGVLFAVALLLPCTAWWLKRRRTN